MIFGEGDGRLDTVPAVHRRMQRWQIDLGARYILWRSTRDMVSGKYFHGRGYRHFYQSNLKDINWNAFQTVPDMAHELGLKCFLYVSLFDEGWPLPPPKVRAVSYHNEMHCQHVSWQSDFSRNNPGYAELDRSKQKSQWGVLCLAYPEVRRHFIARYQRLLGTGNFDGLFVCLRSQSKPADFADQFGFNQPVRDQFRKRYGRDIWHEDFDLADWRNLRGRYLTVFLAELKKKLSPSRRLLAVGIPRGNILGPPLGNMTLEWQRWIQQGLVDRLIIDQNSSRCPSMWHELWPMHRGYGYLQNYLDGHNMNAIEDDLARIYQPILKTRDTELFLARQWKPRSAHREERLLANPAVAGLVFSSFRHDNPGPIRRNDWRA